MVRVVDRRSLIPTKARFFRFPLGYEANVEPSDDDLTLEVREEEAGQRVDTWLAARIEALSRRQAKALVDEGRVWSGRRRLKKSDAVAPNSMVTVRGFATELAVDSSAALEVLAEHEDWIVLSKPEDLPSHPLRSDETDSLVQRAMARFPELASCGRNALEPGLVHRLDVDTTGAVLLARNAEAFAALVDLLDRGQFYKEYIAVCAGSPRPQVIDAPIGNHPKDKRRAAVRLDVQGAKSSQTRVLRVERFGPYSLVHVRADKATRHQVRVHLAWVGHPLVGDTLYGGPSSELGRHLLHASCIAFDYGGQRFEVRAPLPASVQAFLAKAAEQHHT